jgi:hypothetical protein
MLVRVVLREDRSGGLPVLGLQSGADVVEAQLEALFGHALPPPPADRARIVKTAVLSICPAKHAHHHDTAAGRQHHDQH